jgi:segregation and condensation protein B
MKTVMDDVLTATEIPPPASAAASPGPAIEAILLTSDRPVSVQRLAEALGLIEMSKTATHGGEQARGAAPSSAAAHIAEAVEALNQDYAATGRSFRIEKVAGGYRLMTLPAFAPVLAAFHRTRVSNRLSRAAVETLAIIAYKQPLTRAHLESIRGVSCGEVLRSLMDRRLVTITGRAEDLGRPMLYGTTKEFLDAFGLASLKDLPTATELQVNQ